MIVIPAIDIKNGKCVRLSQGQITKETIYYDNPVECAKLWQSQGATRLHLVDLDGAFSGETTNFAIIKQIKNECPQLEIQVGGGIRTEQDAFRYLVQVNINYIIIGTFALSQPKVVAKLADEYPQRVYLACDIKDGKIHNNGWQKAEVVSLEDTLKQFSSSPLAGLIVTDIKNDGMLGGVDADAFTSVAAQSSLPVIAAGGITNIDDIRNLKSTQQIFGVVCGKSIYEQMLDLRQAINLAQE